MSVALCYSGSLLTNEEGGSAFDSAVDSPNMSPLPMAFHSDRSMDHFCSSSTLPTSARWLLHFALASVRRRHTILQLAITESHVLHDQLSNCVEDICSWMCSH
jgi:hypothetical protein